MRNRIANILWGLVFVVIGIGFMGNVFDWWHFSLFFPGWWTLFIIVPCGISVVKDGFNIGNVIGLGIGFVLLLSSQGFWGFDFTWKMIVPLILICVGIAIIFKNNNPNKNNSCHFNCNENNQGKNDYIETNYSDPSYNNSYTNTTTNTNTEYNNSQSTASNNKGDIPEITSIFGSQEKNYNNSIFKGANLCAIFGGVELDLRNSIIPQNCIINCCTIFGGADILFPPNVNVVVHSTPIFGGVSNGSGPCAYANAPTVEVHATCIFGGVDVK